MEITQPEKEQSVVVDERRRTHRFRRKGYVEFSIVASHCRRQGQLKDVSQQGCFIETRHVLPVESQLDITLYLANTCLRIIGIVRNVTDTGMGIEFDGAQNAAKARHLYNLIQRN